MTRLRSRFPYHLWGALGVVLLGLAAYVIFGGRAGLGARPFVLKALFRSDAQLVVRAPVRIAGVEVGRVTAIKPVAAGGAPGAAEVTMQLQDVGLPLHADATAKIRSRLLLEGNFSVELRPGSPGAPLMHSGDTIPADATSGPVQLDRILSDLPGDTRTNLRTTVQGLGGALGTAAATRRPGEDPSTVGKTGGQALNASLADLPAALLGTAQTTDALLGLRPGDLAGAVRAESAIVGTLADHDRQLAELLRGFDTTTGAFAAEQAPLRRAVTLLPGVLSRARRALSVFGRALPATRAFARTLNGSIGELPATIAAAGPWLTQVRLLLGRPELGGLAARARPATRDAAGVLGAATPLLGTVDRLSRCALHNLLPTSEVRVLDPPLTTGAKSYQEFFQTFVGVASAAQNFDGNGVYVRAQPGGGGYPIVTAPLPGQGPLRGNATRPPLGTRPAYPGKAKEPAFRPDVPCATQTPPDINGARTGVGP